MGRVRRRANQVQRRAQKPGPQARVRQEPRARVRQESQARVGQGQARGQSQGNLEQGAGVVLVAVDVRAAGVVLVPQGRAQELWQGLVGVRACREIAQQQVAQTQVVQQQLAHQVAHQVVH